MVAATSWATRLRSGLARTRAALGGGLGALFGRDAIDASLYDALEDALLAADCGVAATRVLLERLRERASRERIADPQALRQALQEELRALLAPLEKRLDLERPAPIVIMVAGVNGAGKTTSIGKLAKWLQAQGKSVLLAAGDTFRAAAREQLAAWGERNGVAVIAQRSGDAAAVAFDAVAAARARGIDVVIADTAGRLPTQLHLMEEIKQGQARDRQGDAGRAARSAAGARRQHRPERARAGRRPSTRRSASPGSCSPSSTARPRAASSARSRASGRCRCCSSASARALTTCGRSTPRTFAEAML